MKKFLFVLILAVIVAGGVWYAMQNKPSSTPAPSSEAGKHCGGNIANAPTCGTGYHCAPDPASHLPFGDVGGLCVAD